MTQYRSQSRLSVRGRQGPISPRNGYSAHRPDCPAGRGQIGAGMGIIGHPTRHEPPERPGRRDTMKLKKQVKLTTNKRAVFSGDFSEEQIKIIADILERSEDTFRLVGLLNLMEDVLREVYPKLPREDQLKIHQLLELKDALV